MSYTVFDEYNPYADARLEMSSELLQARSRANKIARFPGLGPAIAEMLHRNIDQKLLVQHQGKIDALARIQATPVPEHTPQPQPMPTIQAVPQRQPYDFEREPYDFESEEVKIARARVDSAYQIGDPFVPTEVMMDSDRPYWLHDKIY